MRFSRLRITGLVLLAACWLPLCLAGGGVGSRHGGGSEATVSRSHIESSLTFTLPPLAPASPGDRNPGQHGWPGKGNGSGGDTDDSEAFPRWHALAGGVPWSVIPSPPGLATVWQFSLRAARGPRAPSSQVAVSPGRA